jgi:hypothetical protein
MDQLDQTCNTVIVGTHRGEEGENFGTASLSGSLSMPPLFHGRRNDAISNSAEDDGSSNRTHPAADSFQ